MTSVNRPLDCVSYCNFPCPDRVAEYTRTAGAESEPPADELVACDKGKGPRYVHEERVVGILRKRVIVEEIPICCQPQTEA